MAHLNGHSLKTWKKGDGLAAIDLNQNFAALADRIEHAMATALMPDPANVSLEMKLARLEARTKTLEEMSAMHARQRNEKEWAPLSHLGGLVVLVNQLRADLEKAVFRLDQMHASLGSDHDDLHRRIARIEQRPQAATEESFAALVGDFKRVAQKEHMLLAQIIALRHETSILRELALGHDRVANRLEYAPMSTIGHLLQRIMALEAAK